MNFTIFGYPKSGKTTLFNLLTGADIEITGYDTGKKEPNLRTSAVPDPRLDQLSSLYSDKEKKPAMIDYIDLAGISYGEVKTEGYLNHLRKADGLAHVVRGFRAVQIPHHKGEISPQDDIQAMEEELILADLFQIESRAEKLEKELKRGKTPALEKEQALIERIRTTLEQGTPLRELELSSAEEKLLRSFAFLSQKPLFFMLNLDESDIPFIDSPEKVYPVQKPHTAVLAFCGKIELEIRQLEPEEKSLFLDEYGMKELSDTKFRRAS
ncbi:MAG: redox-regulated ATPase YchF, partial [Candidatus Aminicenantes bacterium]|nr:redox-regulated ATPase YchF [Candidatus Aminicenantes bacterium]